MKIIRKTQKYKIKKYIVRDEIGQIIEIHKQKLSLRIFLAIIRISIEDAIEKMT